MNEENIRNNEALQAKIGNGQAKVGEGGEKICEGCIGFGFKVVLVFLF